MRSNTTPETAAAATIPAALPLDQPQLLGLFSGPDGARALIRLPDGATAMASAGDAVPGGTLAQITETYVLIRQGNRLLRLSMPA